MLKLLIISLLLSLSACTYNPTQYEALRDKENALHDKIMN